jgi:hypothetical protein
MTVNGWTLFCETDLVPESFYAPVSERFVPPVNGVDIEHSLNYVLAAGVALHRVHLSENVL